MEPNLVAFVPYYDNKGEHQARKLSNVRLRFDTARVQYMFKTIPMSKRLPSTLSSAQLSTRLYNIVHLIQNSLRDTTMEDEFTNSEGGSPDFSVTYS